MIQQTSLMAHDEVKKNLNHRQTYILETLASQGPMTNSEISAWLGWSINRVTPRTFELRRAGKVALHEKRKCIVTGRLAMAWKITDLTSIQMEFSL